MSYNLDRQKNYRKLTNNMATKKYEKSKNGFLMRLYRNMQSRILGIQKEKIHLYKNKSLLEREDFYKWALESKDFEKLFSAWEKNCYDRKLTPTVDRINSSKGYELDNMRWLTHSENSRIGSINAVQTKQTYKKNFPYYARKYSL